MKRTIAALLAAIAVAGIVTASSATAAPGPRRPVVTCHEVAHFYVGRHRHSVQACTNSEGSTVHYIVR